MIFRVPADGRSRRTVFSAREDQQCGVCRPHGHRTGRWGIDANVQRRHPPVNGRRHVVRQPGVRRVPLVDVFVVEQQVRLSNVLTDYGVDAHQPAHACIGQPNTINPIRKCQ